MAVALLDEVRGVDLGDKRLNRRLGKVIEELGAKPNLSIPAATDARKEMEAAYRFFDNDKVSPEKILQPHIKATHERISQTDLVLLVQDTTELDLTRPNQQVAGAGPMDCEVRRGAFVHPLMAFDSEGVPLGTTWQKTWVREAIETTLSKAEKCRKRQQTPIEEKESLRWVEGLRAAREVAAACPHTVCVCVGDSEADIYELFSEPRSANQGEVQLLVRACQTRSTTESNWLEEARCTPCLYSRTVNVSSRKAKIAGGKSKREQSRDARLAEVEVRATTVTLRPPHRHDRKLPEVTMNVVLVEEPNPPTGCEPIQWILVTTLPIDDLEQVKTIVQSYCIRWQIEIYFKTLKTGCRVEERQFENLERLMNCLAVYSIIAWRVMYLCRLGRECPDLDCEVVFAPSEWRSVYTMVKHQPPPPQPPRLNDIIRLIASLGGYVIRKSTHPGPQTLWIGLQRVHDLSTAWETFGPG
ncbi:MAG: IS4 family transposase [Pirellulaceae bacterium]|jgi:hypothetical protein|nr:IS4 family transposase [Pirellulaceae bacterium]|tara:strand:+ start:197 stop:1606 length:1410 start_codon:yes stop_codon:yes gene_type:complete